jgi:hypothetical protein
MNSVVGELLISASIILMFVAFITLCAWMYPTMTEVKKMDCAMVEFSPDISTEIKQLCREVRGKR